jgi:hypothetical protein
MGTCCSNPHPENLEVTTQPYPNLIADVLEIN